MHEVSETSSSTLEINEDSCDYSEDVSGASDCTDRECFDEDSDGTYDDVDDPGYRDARDRELLENSGGTDDFSAEPNDRFQEVDTSDAVRDAADKPDASASSMEATEAETLSQVDTSDACDSGPTGYVPSWNETGEAHDVGKDVGAVNPRYYEGIEWQQNCQRCAPAYEMRRRGYDVEAQPCPVHDNLSYRPEDAWENPDVRTTEGNGKESIKARMSEWGDGSRAEILVYWKEGEGHAFSAEQINGETIFVDPQKGVMDAEWYFDEVKEDGSTRFWRTDDIEPSSDIEKCCKEVRHD